MIQIRSDRRMTPAVARRGVEVLRLAEAMGLAGAPAGRLAYGQIAEVADQVAEQGIGTSPAATLTSDAPLSMADIRRALDSLLDAMKESPLPVRAARPRRPPWPRSTRGAGPYLGAIPAPLPGRAAAACRTKSPDAPTGWQSSSATCGAAYTALGVRRWFERPRSQLDGSAPQQLLSGEVGPGRSWSAARLRPGAGAARIARHVIVFRHADPSVPFLWEDASQPAGPVARRGRRPAHYLAETPDAAWASSCATRRSAMRPTWPASSARSGRSRSPKRALRPCPPPRWHAGRGARLVRRLPGRGRASPGGGLGLRAPWRRCTRLGERLAGERRAGSGRAAASTIVLFGRRSDLVGWVAADAGRPVRICCRACAISATPTGRPRPRSAAASSAPCRGDPHFLTLYRDLLARDGQVFPILTLRRRRDAAHPGPATGRRDWADDLHLKFEGTNQPVVQGSRYWSSPSTARLFGCESRGCRLDRDTRLGRGLAAAAGLPAVVLPAGKVALASSAGGRRGRPPHHGGWQF